MAHTRFRRAVDELDRLHRRAAEAAAMEAARIQRQERLSRQRAERERVADARRQAEAEDAALRAADEAVAQEREAAARDRIRRQIAAFREAQVALSEAEAALARERAAWEAQEADEHREEREARIGFRQAQREARLAERDRLAEREAELRRRREAALDQLRAEVPYAARLAEIEAASNLERLHSHTAASQVAAELGTALAEFLRHEGRDRRAEPLEGLPAALLERRIAEGGLYPERGFSDARVFADARSRLAFALHASGVAHSAYAREALAAATRPVTQAFRSQVSFGEG